MFCLILTCSFISSRPQIALLPRYSFLEIFTAGDPDSIARKQSYERYRCHETAKSVSRPQMSEVCAKLITSMSALINDGALRECQQRMLGLWREYWGLISLVHVVIKSRSLIPQLVSAILRVRSSLSVMSVGDSAAASPTYQAGAVINVHQELTALALPAANVRQIFSLLWYISNILIKFIFVCSSLYFSALFLFICFLFYLFVFWISFFYFLCLFCFILLCFLSFFLVYFLLFMLLFSSFLYFVYILFLFNCICLFVV